jgi:hypothetical protein
MSENMIDAVDPFSAQRKSRLLQVRRHLRRSEAVQQRLLLIAQPLLLEARADARLEQHRIDGLRKVVLGAQFDAAHYALDAFERRRDENGQVAQLEVVLQLLEYLEAVHLRHLHVEQKVNGSREHVERDATVLRGRDYGLLLRLRVKSSRLTLLSSATSNLAPLRPLSRILEFRQRRRHARIFLFHGVERGALRGDRGGESGQLELLRLRRQSERPECIAVGLQRMGGAPEGVGVTGREGAAQVAQHHGRLDEEGIDELADKFGTCGLLEIVEDRRIDCRLHHVTFPCGVEPC